MLHHQLSQVGGPRHQFATCPPADQIQVLCQLAARFDINVCAVQVIMDQRDEARETILLGLSVHDFVHRHLFKGIVVIVCGFGYT
jgi:hypothetical protein